MIKTKMKKKILNKCSMFISVTAAKLFQRTKQTKIKQNRYDQKQGNGMAVKAAALQRCRVN